MNHSDSPSISFKSWGPIGMALAILGIILLAVGFMGGETMQLAAMQSYTFAFIFIASLVIGCFGLTLFHHTVRATWGLSLLRFFEAGGGPAAIVLLMVLFAPIAWFHPHVYHWATPEALNDHILHTKAWWLSSNFWIIRTYAYLLIWLFFAWKMRASSLRQDESLDPREAVMRTNWSAPGMVVFFVTVTLATTDWVMSLEPHWFSTVLGLLYALGGSLTALSLFTWIVGRNADKAPYNEVATPGFTKDLGNMMFANTLLWTYLTLSQFLITWSGNLPEEIPYYIRRSEMGWNILGTLIIVFQFFVPFLALLAPRTKRYAKGIMFVAMVILITRFLDVYWLTMPAFAPLPGEEVHGNRTSLVASLQNWTDYVALLAVIGAWLAVFAAQITKGALIPKHDTRLQELAEHAHA